MQILCDTSSTIKSKIINMRQNINFLSPEINMDFSSADLCNYEILNKLKNQISQNYKILKEQFEFFNGDFGAILSLFKRLNPSNCFIYSPIDIEYKVVAEKFGCKVEYINRFTEMSTDILENSFVIFSNPSFPDGKFYELEKLLILWKSKNATVFIDESFLDFTNEKSASNFLTDFSNIYILRSTKMFYGNSSISASLLISSVSNIKNVREFEPNNKLSIFDILYLKALMEDKVFKKVSKALIVKNNILLEKVLTSSSLFETVYPSRVNFILAKLNKMTALEFQKKLEIQKILINNCSEFDFLDNSFIQITVKNEDEIKKLREAIKKIEQNKTP